MDLLLRQIRAAYREKPVFTAAFLFASGLIGVLIGYRLLGPVIFG